MIHENTSVSYIEYERMEVKLKRRINRLKRDKIELKRQLFNAKLDAETLLQSLEMSEAMVSHLRLQIKELNKQVKELT